MQHGGDNGGSHRSSAQVFLYLFSLLASAPVLAQEGSLWSFDASSSIIAQARSAKVRSEWTNPDNQVYQLPQHLWQLAVRPEIKLSRAEGSDLTLILRPRFEFEEQRRTRRTEVYKRVESSSRTFVSEAYVASAFADGWQAVVGLQNYQWGPAELASPSNPIFRDLGLDKLGFFETRGKFLLRANYSPDGQTSLVVLVEPAANGEDRPAFEETFQRRALVKAEYSDATQTDYLGLILAAASYEAASLGFYGNFEALPGLSFYGDLLLHRPDIWYPSLSPADEGFVLGRPGSRAGARYTTAIIGGRYVAENGSDLRLEFFHDESAWTRDERSLGFFALASETSARNVELFTKPGSLLPGRDFVYASFRTAEWGGNKPSRFSLRGIRSSSDESRSAIANIDTSWNDHIVLNLGVQVNEGRTTGELSQGYSSLVYGGGSWTW